MTPSNVGTSTSSHPRRFDPNRITTRRAIHPKPTGGGSAAPAARERLGRELRDDEFEQLAPVRALLRRELTYRRLLAAADACGALASMMLVALVWDHGLRWAFLACPVLAVIVAKVQGLYDRDDMVVRKSTLTEWRAVMRTAALAGIGSYLIWYATTSDPQSRGLRVFAALVASGFAITLALRTAARLLARLFTAHERCLIVGAPERCEVLAHTIDEVPGVDLLGTVSEAHLDCSVAGVQELVEHLGVQRLIVGPHPESREASVLALIRSAKWLGVRVSLMPTLMTVVGTATAVDELDSIVLLGVPKFGLSRSSAALKRTLDLILGGLVLLLAAPPMLLIAIVIRLDSPGPSLFRQRRIGRDGEPFTIFKFRSMVTDAESMEPALRRQSQTEGLFKLPDDPRITRIGRLLRRSYLDELPQLFNVMRGEMSLVGPRPLVESEDALLRGHDRHRSRLTPGMTGPWQLRGPLNASLAELARLDYMYASNWSIWADIDILVGTVGRVLRRHGH